MVLAEQTPCAKVRVVQQKNWRRPDGKAEFFSPLPSLLLRQTSPPFLLTFLGLVHSLLGAVLCFGLN